MESSSKSLQAFCVAHHNFSPNIHHVRSHKCTFRSSFDNRTRRSDTPTTPFRQRAVNHAFIIFAQHSVLPQTSSPATALRPPLEITPQTLPQHTHDEEKRTKPSKSGRYIVRQVELKEVYTVADIRCEAFYEHPKDPYFYPVRRREIYMAMRDRIDSGNKCLVVVDTQPPSDWEPFAANGELVVGSLDISLHDSRSGRKCQFLKSIFERPTNCDAPTENEANKVAAKRIYISSMAIRKEWRGRGLAQLLLAYVDDLASRQNTREVFLHVEWDNKPAVHVYKKCGFQTLTDGALIRLPKWLHFITKAEHTLMRKLMEI
ncbi:hypothetical protein BWQ96_02606 [Gracilariopsis chorda]|uniref:N-acetyltransferase domain-containing protein n=1 Tax=Gracilariopsis chorda TaxID=448386 RepID=A0A2V3J108_9FLOR|nr:hypothetical protein BWQ96_02606 [Gracilariopsis chorda]|eukprot:PXF47627.1 hypothetical protein BWQ96_02606 [Gracilariopsis chorda]